jgi:two-component system nitrogen regulation sensor histidine kinase NtrY
MKSFIIYPKKLGTRIYISMLALLLGSFFLIGISTFYNFKSQNVEYHNNRLQRKEAATLASVAYYLKDKNPQEFNDTIIYKLFKYKLNELADIHNLDIILYNLKGELILSSNKEIVQTHLLPNKLDSASLSELEQQASGRTELLSFDGEDYLNSYQFVYDQNSSPFAIISTPYFQLNETYKRDLRAYFVALSPIYVFLFFGASIIAYLLSKQIAEPIAKLSSVMRKAALAKRYMPLSWKSSDEIGQLVAQYNFMVKELEMSSEKLAQTQKEFAWKEMAKQVAHEIKNPLTPMKLNVQMFERKANTEDPEFPVKMKKFTSSLIEQIDTLAHIASAFSDFARMPSSNKEELNLSEIVENTISFFDPLSSGILKLDKDCFVFADHDQIVRVLNNLLNNAIEAVADGETPTVTVSLEKGNHKVLVQVEDNGMGIPLELQDKIFEPNFTTKTSGTGLGLAMVKRIIDDLNGHIYFETVPNNGTTFYISLPLLKQKA